MGTKALAIDERSVPAICSLSKALVEKGLYDEAAWVYRKLPAPANDHDVVAYGWLVESLLRNQLFGAGRPLLDRLLDGTGLSVRQRFGHIVQKAVDCWLADDVEGCNRYIDDTAAISELEGDHNLEHAPKAYAQFLKRLSANRRHHPELYQGQAPDTLHVIGESHCLSPHGTTVDLGGSLYRLESYILMGCKAWQLADPVENSYQRAFWSISSKLPEGANLLVTFGEIDCRVIEGIYPRHKKSDVPLDDIITLTAGGFVEFVATLAAEKSQQVNFCGIPAPSPERLIETPLAGSEQAVYLDMIRRFNIAIEAAATARQLGFVDLYSLTVSENGLAGGSQHIDGTHLYPSTFHQALLNA